MLNTRTLLLEGRIRTRQRNRKRTCKRKKLTETVEQVAQPVQEDVMELLEAAKDKLKKAAKIAGVVGAGVIGAGGLAGYGLSKVSKVLRQKHEFDDAEQHPVIQPPDVLLRRRDLEIDKKVQSEFDKGHGIDPELFDKWKKAIDSDVYSRVVY